MEKVGTGSKILKEIVEVKKIKALTSADATRLAFFECLFSGQEATKQIAKSPLNELMFNGCKLNTFQLEPLAKMASLSSFFLYDSSSNEYETIDICKLLSTFPQLTKLTLYKCSINDKSLSDIAKLTNLTKLDLGDNNITDRGVSQLRNLNRLDSLELFDNYVSDEGAYKLLLLPCLTKLQLGSNKISFEGACFLAKMTSLRTLTVTENPIGNVGLGRLCSQHKLRAFHFGYDSQITEWSGLSANRRIKDRK